MKIAIFPNNSVLLSSLVRKNNHTPLMVFTPTDSDEKYDKNQAPFNMTWKNHIKNPKKTDESVKSNKKISVDELKLIIDKEI